MRFTRSTYNSRVRQKYGTLWVATMALSPPLGVTSEADDILAMAADELSVQVTSAVLGDIRYDRLDITVYDTDGDTVDTVVTRRWWWTRTRGGCW